MRVVLDASAAITTVMSRAKARSFAEHLESADEVLAPDLFVAEVINTVWKYHQLENLGLDICDQWIDSAIHFIDTLVPCEQVHREAFLLARTTRRPTYDMFYLALARREDAAFLTADHALRREAERQGI